MGPSEHPIVVVVVAYGSVEQLAVCLRTLGPGLPVVVVDNGCSDDASQVCIDAGAEYVRPAANVGFGAAVNMALRDHRAAGTDVLLLNPDAQLLPSDLTVLRHELLRSGNLAAVGPRLLNTDGSSQKALWPIPSPLTAWAALVGCADLLSRRRFVSGAVLLLRGEAVDAIGNFDDRFFLYYEESDWQLRAMRAGWHVAVSPCASAVHVSGGTSSDPVRRELFFNASAELFIRKWYGKLGWQTFRVATICTSLRRLALSRGEQERRMQRRTIALHFRGPARCAAAVRDL